VNYVEGAQDISLFVCRECGNYLDEPRNEPEFSADDVLNEIIAVSKDTIHDMDLTGCDFCDVVHVVAERLNEEYC